MPRTQKDLQEIKSFMSTSTVEKPIVWHDQERKAMKASRIPSTIETPDSVISTKEPAPLWIELTSEHNTTSISGSLADEKRDHDVSHDEESARSSKSGSVEESDIVYPSTLRVSLVTLSLAIAVFLIGLDRTIVATAT